MRAGPDPIPSALRPSLACARVVVLTRADCHLCEQALAVVRPVCAETAATLVVLDVDSDPELRRYYTDQVPVTFVDGEQHDFWRVDEQRLRHALSHPAGKQ